MNKAIALGTRSSKRLFTQYPQIFGTDKSDDRDVVTVDYRRSDIEKRHVLFWHRLLKHIYQEPSELECILEHCGKTYSFRKSHEPDKWTATGVDEHFVSRVDAGTIRPVPVNWKYLIKLPSDGILEFGTKDTHTAAHIARVLRQRESEETDNEEARTFIDIILAEAARFSDHFHPEREFEKTDTLKLYLLFNVYLSNYLSGTTMLDTAQSEEAFLGQDLLKYDARPAAVVDDTERDHIDQSLLKCGTYYCASISYFFMALEGFVNLLFHAFLKCSFRDKELNVEARLDLEQKLRFLTILCDGFKQDSGLSTTVFSGFKTLKKYRNILFHSKVEDSLKNLVFVEDGFMYTYDLETCKDASFPTSKFKMTYEHVAAAKSIVDDIVHSILDLMNDDTRAKTEQYILSQPTIPVSIIQGGTRVLGIRS